LPLAPIPPAAFEFILQVERFYAGLMRHAPAGHDFGESNLGGRLVYVGDLGGVGEPTGAGRSLMVASNLAGAASLAATADAEAQRQSIRDGVADFVVTNLDEALRILKNEVRKHEAVAVCVAADAAAIEQEMLERGVVPDLRRSDMAGAEPAPAVLTWRVGPTPAQWLPKLDAIALECLGERLDPAAHAARRWLRLAPRYLGRQSHGVRLVRCRQDFYDCFSAKVRAGVDEGKIPLEVEVNFIVQQT
jgi:hypothetical protein